MLPHRPHLPDLGPYCDAIAEFVREGEGTVTRLVEVNSGNLPIGALCALNASIHKNLHILLIDTIASNVNAGVKVVQENFPLATVMGVTQNPLAYRHRDGAIFDIVLLNPLFGMSDHTMNIELLDVAKHVAATLQRNDGPSLLLPRYVYLRAQMFAAPDATHLHDTYHHHRHRMVNSSSLNATAIGSVIEVFQISLLDAANVAVPRRHVRVTLHTRSDAIVHGLWFWWDWGDG